MTKPVALILLNWNTVAHTSRCIASIMRHCDARDYDLIVADNGSTDDSLPILQAAFPQHIYIDNKENLGFAEGNNRALDYSIKQGYAYSLLLNSDTEVDENFIAPLLEYMNRHAAIAAVQPAIYFLHQKDQLWNGGSFFNSLLGITYAKNQPSRQTLTAPEAVDWLTGCCFFIRNSALVQTGTFNRNYFLYHEDVELSFRLKKAGFQLQYFPGTKVFHEAGVSGKQLRKDKEGILSPIIHYYLCRNNIWFLRQYGKPLFKPLMFLYHSFYYTALYAYFLLRGRKQKAAYLYKGIKEGLMTPISQIYT